MVRFGQNIILSIKTAEGRLVSRRFAKKQTLSRGMYTAQFIYKKTTTAEASFKERLSSNLTYGVLQLYGQSAKSLQTQFLGGARLCGRDWPPPKDKQPPVRG